MSYKVDIVLEDLICPITKQIFLDPVMASDGKLYERQILEKWMNDYDCCSPLTKEDIKFYSSSTIVKNMITYLLEMNPNLKEDQYELCMDHAFHRSKIIEIMEEGNYEDLKLYRNFSIEELYYNGILKKFLKGCHDLQTVSYLFNNRIDSFRTNKGWKPVHYVSRWGNGQLIKQMTEAEDFDLDATTSNGWKPIHFVARYGSIESLMYLVNVGVDIEQETKKGWKPIHFVARYGSIKSLMEVVHVGAGIEPKTKNGWKPVHFVFRWHKFKDINSFLELNPDLKSRTDEGYTFDMLKRNRKISNTEKDKLIKAIIK